MVVSARIREVRTDDDVEPAVAVDVTCAGDVCAGLILGVDAVDDEATVAGDDVGEVDRWRGQRGGTRGRYHASGEREPCGGRVRPSTRASWDTAGFG